MSVFVKLLLKTIRKTFLDFSASWKIVHSRTEIFNKFKLYTPSLNLLNIFLLVIFYFVVFFGFFLKSDILLLIYGFEEIYKQICLFINLSISKFNGLEILYQFFMEVYDFGIGWFRFINFFNIYIPESLKDPSMMYFFKNNVEYGNSLQVGGFTFSFYLKNLRGNLEWVLYYKIRLGLIRKSNLRKFLEIYTEDLKFIRNKKNKTSFDKKMFYFFNNIIIRLPFYIKIRLKRLNKFLYKRMLPNMDFSHLKNFHFAFIFISIFILNFFILLQYLIDLVTYIFQDIYIYILYINKLQFDLFFDFYLYLKQYLFYNVYYFINNILFDNNILILLQSFIAYIIEYNKYIFIILKNFILDLFYSSSRNSNILQGFKNKLYYRGNLMLEYYRELNYKTKLKYGSHLPKNFKILNFKNKIYAIQAMMGNSHYPSQNGYNIFYRKKKNILEDFSIFDKSKISFVIKGDPILNLEQNSFMLKFFKNTFLYILFIFNLIISFFVLGNFGYTNFKKDINYVYVENAYSLMTIFMMRKNNLSDYVSKYGEILIVKNVFEEIYDDEEFDKDIDGRIPTFDLTVSDNLLAFEKFYSQKINNIKLNENTYSKYLEIELKSEGANKVTTFLNNFELQIYTLAKIKNILYNKIKLKGYMLYVSYICRFIIQKINQSLNLKNKYITFIHYNANLIHNYYLTKNHTLLNLHFTTGTNQSIKHDLNLNNNFNYITLLLSAFNNLRYKHIIRMPFIIMHVDKKKLKIFDFLEKEIFQWKFKDPNYESFNEQLYNINKIYKLNITEKKINPFIYDFKHRQMSSEGNLLFNLVRIIIYIFILSCIYSMSNGIMELDFIYNIKETISTIFYYVFLPMQTFTKYVAISIYLIKKFGKRLIDFYYINTSLLTGASDILYDYSFLTYYKLIGLGDTQTVIISNILTGLKMKKFYDLISDPFEFYEGENAEIIIRQLLNLQSLRLYLYDRMKGKNKTFVKKKIPIMIYGYYKSVIIFTIKRIYLLFSESFGSSIGFDMLYYVKKAKNRMKSNVFHYNGKGELKSFFHVEYLIRKKTKGFSNENSFLNGFVFRNKSTGNDIERNKFEDIYQKGEHMENDILNRSLNFKKQKDNVKYVLNKFNSLSAAKYVAKFKNGLFRSDRIKVINEQQEKNKKKIFVGQIKNPFKYRKRYIHYFIQQYTQRPYILNKFESKNPTLRVGDYRNFRNKTDKFSILLKYYLQEILGRIRYIHHKKFFNVYQGKKQYHETEKKYKDLFEKIYQDKYKETKVIRTKLRNFRYDNRKWSNFVFSNRYFYDFKLRKLKDFEGSFISKSFFRFLRYKKDFTLRMGNHPVKPFDDFFEYNGLFGRYKKGANEKNIEKIINVASDDYNQPKGTKKRYLKFIERRNHITRIVIGRKIKKMLLRTLIGNQAVRKTFIDVANKHFGERTTDLRILKKKQQQKEEEQRQEEALNMYIERLINGKNKIKNIIKKKDKDGKI